MADKEMKNKQKSQKIFKCHSKQKREKSRDGSFLSAAKCI